MYFLIIPPSVMEDEGRFRLASASSFASLEHAQKAREKIVDESKGWFRENSIYIVQKI